MFSTFPNGWPGLGLLLLRVAVGVAAIALGRAYATGDSSAAWTSVAVALSILSGALLLVGFVTPVAATLVGISTIGSLLSGLPPLGSVRFDSVLLMLFVAVVATAIVLLGPGAFSLDARLFGRREIIIPRTPRSPE